MMQVSRVVGVAQAEVSSVVVALGLKDQEASPPNKQLYVMCYAGAPNPTLSVRDAWCVMRDAAVVLAIS